jgi:hypothetical protein
MDRMTKENLTIYIVYTSPHSKEINPSQAHGILLIQTQSHLLRKVLT